MIQSHFSSPYKYWIILLTITDTHANAGTLMSENLTS